MLRLIKFGTNAVGHAVPALAVLKAVDLMGPVKEGVGSVTAKIDYSLECIDNQSAAVQVASAGDCNQTESHAVMAQQDLHNYLSDVEGLEGVELRQLGTFLDTSEDENLPGNLYRMTQMAMSSGFVANTTEPVIKKSRSKNSATWSSWHEENSMSS